MRGRAKIWVGAWVLAACGGDDASPTSATGGDDGATADGGTVVAEGSASGDGGDAPGDSSDAGDGSTGGTAEDPNADGPLAAFPGAEGWGTDTPGGRGGRVMIVDTLSWDGPGSFSEALLTPEPRTIVFEVSGVIEVPEEVPGLDASHAFVTVAGQTSPGGITFLGGGAALTSYHADFHDGVFRHLRFRGETSYDNVTLAEVHHVVLDHCDFSGGEDETLDITYAHDVTVSWSTITNSGPGGQRYGFLLAYPPTDKISFHHNLSAHHVNRCGPHMHWGDGGAPDTGANIDLRNNVLYDCAFEQLFSITGPESGSLAFNVVGNFGKSGPSTPVSDSVAILTMGAEPTYAADNVYEDYAVFHPWSEPTLLDAPHDAPPVTTTDPTTAYDEVLAAAEAWPRDAMNERTVAEVLDGTGQLGVVGDALIEDGPAPPPDTDRDGMPDEWEVAHDLDPAVDDSAGDIDDDGWTNLEEYLHARAIAVGQG